MKAISERNLNIINLFEDYLKEYDKDESYIDDNELEESDKENSPLNIGNSNKKTKRKGHPKGTKRIKASYESNAVVGSNKQYRCSHCGGIGYNKQNCKNNL